MTDRVLTEKEIDSLAHLGELGLGGLYGAEVRVLIASHRLLTARVTELERQVEVQRRNPCVVRVKQLEQEIAALMR